MVRENDVLFGHEAVRKGLCTLEQVQSAIDEVETFALEGGVPAVLIRMGHLGADQAQTLAEELGMTFPVAGDDAAGEEELEPLAVVTCDECGRTFTTPDPESVEASRIFGQVFCSDCLEDIDAGIHKTQKSFQKAVSALENRKRPARKKVRRTASKDRAGLAELARSVSPETKPKTLKPPPLPRRIHLERDLEEGDLEEIQRLLGKNREEEAVALVRKVLVCSEPEARKALGTYQASRPPEEASRGIFGFARLLGKSTIFYMNVAFGKWEKVIEDGGRFLEADPENVYLLATLGEAHEKSGNHAEAEVLLKRGLDVDEGSIRILTLLGDLYLGQKRFRDALSILGALSEYEPENAAVWEKLVACCLETGDLERALEPMGNLARLQPSKGIDHRLQRIEILYRLRRFARALTELGDVMEEEGPPYDRTLTMARRILDAAPGNVRGLNLIARLHEIRKEWKEALFHYEEYLERTPDSLGTLRRCARIAERTGQLGKAIFYLNLALENGPEHRKTRRRLVRLLLRAGEFDEAMEHLRDLLEAKPRDESAIRDLARIHLSRGEYNRAAEILAGAESGDLGELLARARKFLADAELDETLGIVAGDHPDPALQVRLGDAFLGRSLPDLAVERYLEAAASGGEPGRTAMQKLLAVLDAAPDHKRVTLFVDRHRLLLPDPARALDILGSYRKRNPGDAEISRLLLRRLLEAQRHDDALELVGDLIRFGNIYAEDLLSACREMEEKGEDDPRLHLYLGRIYENEGELGQASRHLGTYLESEPRDVDAVGSLVDLARRMDDPQTLFRGLSLLEEATEPGTTLSLELTRVGLGLRRFEESARRVSAILASDPHNVPASKLREEIENQQTDDKISEINKRLAHEPENVSAKFELGELHFRKGDFESASRAFAACKNHKEFGERAREHLFRSCIRLGRTKHALMILQEERIESKLDARTEEGRGHLYRMADLYLDLEMPSRAGKLFFDIYKIDPGFRDVAEKLRVVEVQEELVGPTGKGTEERSWFFAQTGKPHGPRTLREIRDRIAAGEIRESTPVWHPEFSTWKKAGSADKIRLLFEVTRRREGEGEGPKPQL
jgi:tetratricopeptide (TPR) repeat protein